MDVNIIFDTQEYDQTEETCETPESKYLIPNNNPENQDTQCDTQDTERDILNTVTNRDDQPTQQMLTIRDEPPSNMISLREARDSQDFYKVDMSDEHFKKFTDADLRNVLKHSAQTDQEKNKNYHITSPTNNKSPINNEKEADYHFGRMLFYLMATDSSKEKIKKYMNILDAITREES